MRKALVFKILILAYTISQASVELSEANLKVFYSGGRETAGSVLMTVTENDFLGATQETPIFLHFELDKNATLAETLVDQQGEQEAIRQPIFLAMITESNDPGLRITAPANSLSIVRWVKGEKDIWLKVQTSSEAWLEIDGVTLPPSQSRRISWILGQSGEMNAASLAVVPDALRNLPFNSRDQNPTSESVAQDTLLLVNLSNSELTPSGSNATLTYNIEAHGHEADRGDGHYEPLSPLPVPFSGNFIIGEGDGPTRLIPHITSKSGGFLTQLILANLSKEPLTWHLTGMNVDGAWLANAEGVLAGAETKRVAVEILFEDREVAWLAIASEPALKVSVNYRSIKVGSGWADLHEPQLGSTSGRLWRIYPGNHDVTWDGVAVVNTDRASTPLTIVHRDGNGTELGTLLLEETFEPGAKRLYLFHDNFQAQMGSYFEVSAQQGVSVTSLRGNLDSDFIWENSALLISH